MYRPVPPQVDLPRSTTRCSRSGASGRRALARAATEGRPLWGVQRGPPTANGMPGTHHVERASSATSSPLPDDEELPRPPRGRLGPPRPAGRASPSRRSSAPEGDIEAYGRRRVQRAVPRIGAAARRRVRRPDERTWATGSTWATPYRTNGPALRRQRGVAQADLRQGLLTQDYRVTLYCTRCGTGLSDHELARVRDGRRPVGLRPLPLTSGALVERHPRLSRCSSGRRRRGRSCPTPRARCTRTSTYAVTRMPDGELLLVAEGRGASRRGHHRGRDRARPRRWGVVRAAVHQRGVPETDAPCTPCCTPTSSRPRTARASSTRRPAFGAVDLQLLPRARPAGREPAAPRRHFRRRPPARRRRGVLQEGRRPARRRPAGARAVPARARTSTTTRTAGAATRRSSTTRSRPGTSARRGEGRAVRENERTHRLAPADHPVGPVRRLAEQQHRLGAVALALLGHPLPIWRCDDHLTCVESLAELGPHAGQDLSNLDPHRPFVDDVTFPCPECGGAATRVPEVIDAWYDSGAMPFAQFGYPPRKDEFEARYPAGLHLRGDRPDARLVRPRSWRSARWSSTGRRTGPVLCLGHIPRRGGPQDEQAPGNVLEPIPLMDQHGADAVRWFMLAGGSPWQARRVGHGTIQEVVRKTLLTHWNTVSFQALYADRLRARPTPAPRSPSAGARPLALSEAHGSRVEVDEA